VGNFNFNNTNNFNFYQKTMNKIKQESKEFIFHLETYQKNRTVNKILKLLNEDKNFKVSDVESFVESSKQSRIFEIRFNSFLNEKFASELLKTTICNIIKKSFPLNYQFDFRARRLGYTNSFNVFTANNVFCFECYTRIKEMRCDGSSVLPEANNQIKL
jgi:hypothetical protein